MAAHSPQASDGCSRREMMQRVGVASGTIVTLGAGGSQLAPRYSPVGRAEAIAPVVAAGAALAVGAAAGIALESWRQPDTDLDPDDVLADQIYHAASSVAQGREAFADEMEHEYLEAETTPFERSAWQEIRAAAVREIVNGEGEAAALEAAQDALARQETRAIVNITERWNTGINALTEQFTIHAEEALDVFQDGGDEGIEEFVPKSESTINDAISDLETEIEPVESTELNDGYVVWEVSIDTPIPADELEGRDEPLKAICPGINSEWDRHLMAPYMSSGIETEFGEVGVLQVSHSDLDTIDVLDSHMTNEIQTAISSAQLDISDDLSTYVSELYQGIQQGAIDPDDILSSQDIVDQFADADEQSRLEAELLAIGANVPESAGYEAEITHPDLQADMLWGRLYPQWTDDEARSITPGMTIDPEDYEMAYFGYESALEGDDDDDNGSFETVMLSGNEPLEVLTVDGVDGQEVVEQAEDVAGDDGAVTIYQGDDPPEPVADPTDDEYAGWQIVVDGDDSRHVDDLTAIEQDDDEYYLPSTDLSADESINYVEIVPSVEHSRAIDHVADPTDPDTDQTVAELENLREQVDDLEEAADGGGGIGDWFDGDNRGGMLVGAIVVIASIIGIGQLTS